MEFADQRAEEDGSRPQETAAEGKPCGDEREREGEENNDEEENAQFADWSEGEDEESFQSLFSDATFPSIQELVAHDAEHFQFDLKQVVSKVCKDEIDFIKLVNFVRRNRRKENPLSPAALLEVVNSQSFLQSDENMIPVLENDSLLFLFEEFFEFAHDDAEDEAPSRPPLSEEAISAALVALEQKQG